ncbi:MAG: alpha/beta fold hydrolase [Sciscionella sp.]
MYTSLRTTLGEKSAAGRPGDRERPAKPDHHDAAAAGYQVRVGTFAYREHRLAYTEFGSGTDVVVLVHGQLMSRRMHAPLARALAETGFRVITLDLLGHGDSERPEESWRYSMTEFGRQVLALLDHLDVARAVIGGTSLGANVSLEVAIAAPQRAVGLLTEMPVLDNAIVAGLLAFAPLLFTARFAPAVIELTRWFADRVPQGRQWIDVATDTLHQEPAGMAATIHGIFFGRVAPAEELRRGIAVPVLVIGHRRDPVHPFGDAANLAAEIAGARFLEAESPLELRLRPARLTEEIRRFLLAIFAAQPAP